MTTLYASPLLLHVQDGSKSEEVPLWQFPVAGVSSIERAMTTV
jgi:hypothetical protein